MNLLKEIWTLIQIVIYIIGAIVSGLIVGSYHWLKERYVKIIKYTITTIVCGIIICWFGFLVFATYSMAAPEQKINNEYYEVR